MAGAILATALAFAVPVGGLEFRRSSLQDATAASLRFRQTGKLLQPLAPPSGGGGSLLALYRKYTMQYQKDALEAYGAAKMYAEMTQQLSNSINEIEIQGRVKEKMLAMGVDNWAYAAWAVQGMLNDPVPGQAAKAAAEAAAPYNAAFAAYDKSKVQYNTAATGYALRAKQDAELSQQLMSYSNQFRVQGDTTEADQYKGQSVSLMKQAEKFKGLANQYQETAEKIYGVLPSLQSWAGKAGAEAAYEANPLGALPAKEIFPFTVVPPAGVGPPL
jgi:hypothetical protein